jgi:hypothetical protein
MSNMDADVLPRDQEASRSRSLAALDSSVRDWSFS